MPHRTTVTDHDKIYLRPLEQLKAALAALGDRVFGGADADARRHGWQVCSVHFGLGRRYRDPRFDALLLRPDRHARGVDGCGDPCPGCCRAGRVGIGPPDGTHSGASLGRLP
jgi:hypothetical protein